MRLTVKSLLGGFVALLLIAAVAIVVQLSPALRIATASTSLTLCHAAFVSGLDPDKAYQSDQLPQGGMHLIAPLLRYRIDRTAREIHTAIAGGFAGRAIFREPYGCLLIHDGQTPPLDEPPPAQLTLPEAITEPAIESGDPQLRAVLDHGFDETAVPGGQRSTRAIVVLDHGRLVGERYASGYGPDTPIWGHSDTKAVIDALVGIMVRDGKLRIDQPVPVDSGRATATIDQLLRMTSGLPFDDTDNPVNPAIRMWFLEPDPVHFATQLPLDAEPGERWAYSNAGYKLLSRAVRDAAGGDAQSVTRFVDQELFAPLGMRHSRLELDLSGTPGGASFMFASARDWARFGQLFLDDGMVNGRRLLPEGWVRYSLTPTLDTGYGAGWWTNHVKDGDVPIWGVPWGLPELDDDIYFCRGALGQFVVVVPKQQLVIARFGVTLRASSGIGQLVKDVIAARAPVAPAQETVAP